MRGFNHCIGLHRADIPKKGLKDHQFNDFFTGSQSNGREMSGTGAIKSRFIC